MKSTLSVLVLLFAVSVNAVKVLNEEQLKKQGNAFILEDINSFPREVSKENPKLTSYLKKLYNYIQVIDQINDQMAHFVDSSDNIFNKINTLVADKQYTPASVQYNMFQVNLKKINKYIRMTPELGSHGEKWIVNRLNFLEKDSPVKTGLEKVIKNLQSIQRDVKDFYEKVNSVDIIVIEYKGKNNENWENNSVNIMSAINTLKKQQNNIFEGKNYVRETKDALKTIQSLY